MTWTIGALRTFEQQVADAFKAKKIKGPVHLSGGNEEQLIRVFSELSIKPTDWVLCSYRSHYHALLHGIPSERVMSEILAGRSMNLSFPEHRFLTSAIVGGMLPIAVGIAAGIKRSGGAKRVFCFAGDMAASIGTFHDASRYASGHGLPITFVIEDNGLACDTPTREAWGDGNTLNVIRYEYERQWPHVGVGEWVAF